MAAADYISTVQGFYVSYYGRPADPAGLTYWTERLNTEGGNLNAILNAFGTSAEATRRFGTGANDAKVQAIYQQTFGRAADAEGLTFYTAELAAGRITLIDVAKRVIDGAKGDDVAIVANRLAAAQTFTTALNTDAEKAGYSGSGAEDAARSWISTVTKDAATLTAAQATVDATITSLLPQAFTLTTNQDKWTGSAGNDTVSGGVTNLSATNTLGSTDQIDGGAGTDELKVTLAKDFTGFTPGTGFLKNVETLSLTNGAATPAVSFSALGVTGLETVNVSGPVNVSGLAATSVRTNYSGISGAANTANPITLGFVSEAVAGSADSTTIGLTSIGTAPASATASPSAVEFTTAGIETLKVVATGSNFAKLTAGTATTSVKALEVSGEGSLRLAGDTNGAATDGVSAGLKTIDASAMKGALTVNLANAAGVTSVKTGSGNDSITATIDGAASLGDLAITATIDGGSGEDTLSLNVDNGGVARNTGYSMTGVETLNLKNILSALNFSAASVTGLNTITVDATAAAVSSTVTGMGSAAIAVKYSADTVASGALQHTVSVDTTGAVTATVVPSSTATLASPGASNDILTATKSTDVTFTAAQFTNWTGTLNADLAANVKVSGLGDVGATLALDAATALNIEQLDKDVAWGVTYNRDSATASALKSLTVTSKYDAAAADGVVFTTTHDTVALETLVVDTMRPFNFADSGDVTALNNITLSGSGTNSNVNLGTGAGGAGDQTIGSTSLTYDISLTASGLKAGLNLGDISVGPSKNITLNIGDVNGAATIGDLAVATTGGTITVNAKGFGDGANDTLSIDTIAAGTVVLDVADSTDNITTGDITANAVTVKAGTAAGTLTIGGGTTDITAKNSVVYEGTNASANTREFIVGSGSTAFTANLTGSFLGDTYTITSARSTQTSITVTGALGDGSDTLNVSSLLSTATSQTIDISGVTGVNTGVITGALQAKNVLIGGAGDDTITGGTKADIYTGGAGKDIFQFGNVGDTGTVTLADLQTSSKFAALKTVSTTGLDVITDFTAGDQLTIEGFTEATIATTSRLKYDGSEASVGANGTLANGTYSSSAGTFITGTSGTDTLFLYTDGASTRAIVLVGFGTGLTTTGATTGVLASST